MNRIDHEEQLLVLGCDRFIGQTDPKEQGEIEFIRAQIGIDVGVITVVRRDVFLHGEIIPRDLELLAEIRNAGAKLQPGERSCEKGPDVVGKSA